MRRFPIAARDLVDLMCMGPVRQIRGMPSGLMVLTRYPDVLWLCTYVPWREVLARLRAAGAMQEPQQGYLLPFIEQDALYRHGYGWVRMGTFLFPNPPLRGISDGTSNTILVGDGSVRMVGSAPPRNTGGHLTSGGSGGATISDGTSNTILLGEGSGAAPNAGGNTGGSSITDGTSNTILIGEEGVPGPPGSGGDTNVVVGGDVGVNHGPPRNIPGRSVVVGGCA